MDPAREQFALDVFNAALDSDATARDAVIAERCNGDDDLAAYVQRLLRAHDAAGDFLEAPASGSLRLSDLRDLTSSAPPVSRIGPYRVLRELGSGGMGTVYLAEREDGALQRTVAIKLVRRDRESGAVLDRFRSERQILAGLEHPGIARLYDADATDEGEPYFVMEYVDGVHIVTHCRERHLSITDRVDLFCRVCDAVQFAHQHLVVHRDLKPSNILVTDNGDPKLVDFGIAKLLSTGNSGGGTAETLTAVRLMTPEYASPEQIRGERVTTASDVYSLGAILYEVLCGRRPYTLRDRTTSEIERAVLNEAPALPSAAAEASSTRHALRGDLDVILLKALQKDVTRRYQTAAELSDDLRRHLDGLPVRARPDGIGYRTRKFIQRHRGAVAAAAIAIVSLVAGLTVAVWQARVAQQERARAEQRFNEVRQLANSVVFELHDAIQFLPGATEARQLLVTRALQYLDRLSAEQPRDPGLRRELAAAYHRLGDVQGNPLRANLGDTDGAMATYQKSLGLRQSLAAEMPASATDAEGLADIEFEIGALHRIRGNLPEARALLSSMTTRLESAMRLPEHPEVRRKLVAGYQRLAELENVLRNRDAASAAIAKGLVHGESLVRDQPENVGARLNLSTLYVEDRDRLMAEHRTEESLARSHQARQIQEALLESAIQTAAARALLFTLDGEGKLLTSTGDHPGAIRVHEHQWAVAREMSERDTSDRFATLAIIAARQSLANAHRAAGNLDAAIQHLRDARAGAQRASQQDPANAYTRDLLASTAYDLGEALQATDRPTNARESCTAYLQARAAWQHLQTQGQLGAEAAQSLEIIESRLGICN